MHTTQTCLEHFQADSRRRRRLLNQWNIAQQLWQKHTGQSLCWQFLVLVIQWHEMIHQLVPHDMTSNILTFIWKLSNSCKNDNNSKDNVYRAVIMAKPLQEVKQFTWRSFKNSFKWLPTSALGCESACRLLESTPTIAICSTWKLILILQLHRRFKDAVMVCKAVFHNEQNCPWDSILGPQTLQLGMLPVDNGNVQMRRQEAQLSQRGRVMPRVVEYFHQSLKAALIKRSNIVTFANVGSVRLPSLKFVGLCVRKIRRI